MPSARTHRSKPRLWSRMLAALAVVALVSLAIVGVEAVFFGLITYGSLLALRPFAELIVGDPALAMVLAVVAYAAVVVAVLATYRAARETERGFAVAPNLLAYVHVLLVVASLAATYLLIAWAGLPTWVFGVVVVTVLALAYPMALYQTAGGLSDDDREGDEDDAPPWAVEEDGRDRAHSTRENLATIAAHVRGLFAGAADRLGPLGTLAGIAAVIGALAAVYVAAAARSSSAMVLPVAAGLTLVVVGFHVADLVRTELGDAAVLRELDAEFAVEPDPAERESLLARAERLAAQADVPAPDVKLVSSPTPTAAAVGYRPTDSTVVVSTGLVDALDDSELDAVLAHELAHVANRDAAALTALSFPRASAHRAFDRYGMNPVMAVFAGIVALASRSCAAVVARAREYAADDGAVAITGEPAALASALETLDAEVSRRPSSDLRSAAAFSIVPPPWEEHPFFDRTRRVIYRGLLGTHPPTEERIDRLRAHARERET